MDFIEKGDFMRFESGVRFGVYTLPQHFPEYVQGIICYTNYDYIYMPIRAICVYRFGTSYGIRKAIFN